MRERRGKWPNQGKMLNLDLKAKEEAEAVWK
jgi:hypothetical protein